MTIKALVVTLAICCAAPWSAAAAEGTDAVSTQRGPPTGPTTMRDAVSHWDGSGELLLLPPDDESGSSEVIGNFAIGATFDNTDAPRPEVDVEHSAFRRCPSGIYPIRLARGGLIVTSPMVDPWRQMPRIRSSYRSDGSGSFVVGTDRCRFTLSLRVKLREQGEWTPMPRYVPPPPAPPTGETRVLKSGETLTIKFPPTPAELSLWSANSRIGPYVPPDIARKCPTAVGSMWFEPLGLYVSMPWTTNRIVIPGIRRDTAVQTTTLIFQSPECRLELSVRRDIRDGDEWRASSLSVVPSSDGGD